MASSGGDGETESFDSRLPDNTTYSGIIHQKISSMVEEAERATERGDHKRSLAILSRAVSLEPSNHTLFRCRAEAYFQLGDHTAAIANYNKTVSLSPDEAGGVASRLADAHSRRGEQLSREEAYDSALRDFTAASELCPSERNYITRRMDCLLSLGRCEECLKMVGAELERGPPTPHLYLMHAKLSLLFEKSGEAYQSLVRVLELDPAHQEAMQLKRQREGVARRLQDQATKFLLLGQREGALSKISAAIECDPKPAEFHVLSFRNALARGAIHRQSGQFVRAIDEQLSAVDKCRGEGEGEGEKDWAYSAACRQLVLTYNDFAIQCFKKGKYNEAIQLLNKALEEEKKKAGLYINRGDCFYRLDNLYFALADYCRAQHLSPGDWQIRCRVAVTQCELGVKEFSGGNYSEAEKLFSNAITNNPRVSQFYFYRARVRDQLRNGGGAREDLLRLLVLEPECDAALPLIARVFPGKTRADLLISPALATTSAELSSSAEKGEEEREGASCRHETLAERTQRELQELFLELRLVGRDGEGGETGSSKQTSIQT